MNMLRIGLAQCEQVDGLDRNAETIFRFLTRPDDAGVHVLSFPENHSVGSPVPLSTAVHGIPAPTLSDAPPRGAAGGVVQAKQGRRR